MDLPLASRTISTAGSVIRDRCRTAPDDAVPSCPGWSVADLTVHVACIHRWAAGMIDGAELGPIPEKPAGLDAVAWADESRAALLDVMARVDPDREVHTFVGPRPARWWWRRQANETAAHAWDATAGSGSPWAIPPEVAADALDEVLTVFLPRRWGHKPPTWGDGRTVHLHRTDGDGEWLVTIAAAPVITLGHAKGDLAVRGPIAELFLWSMGRPAGDRPGIELFGDVALADAWRANVRI